MAKLEKLTVEQEKLLPVYREKWLKIGLATGPGDKAKAEDAVRRAYQAANLAPPKLVIWLRSPLEGTIGAAFLRDLEYSAMSSQPLDSHTWTQAGSNVRELVGEQVWSQVGAQVWNMLKYLVGTQVNDLFWDISFGDLYGNKSPVSSEIKEQVWNLGLAQVMNQVGNRVWFEIWSEVGAEISEEVWDKIGYQIAAQVEAQAGWSSRCEGPHKADRLGASNYFGEVCGIAEAEKLAPLNELAEHAGWWWPFARLCILTERPTSLDRDEQGRLHSATGPAVGYSDGWGVYAWHGVRVEPRVILEPQKLTAEEITKEDNAEVRRVMMERFGLERFIRECGAQEIARDEFGILYRKNFADDEPLVMVEVINSTPEPDGTRKHYFLRVHPELRPLLGNQRLGPPQTLTPRNAIASTFGLTGEQYQPDLES